MHSKGAETGQNHNYSHVLLPLAQVDAKSIQKMKELLESASLLLPHPLSCADVLPSFSFLPSKSSSRGRSRPRLPPPPPPTLGRSKRRHRALRQRQQRLPSSVRRFSSFPAFREDSPLFPLPPLYRRRSSRAQNTVFLVTDNDNPIGDQWGLLKPSAERRKVQFLLPSLLMILTHERHRAGLS
jgi:hypothetical protein